MSSRSDASNPKPAGAALSAFIDGLERSGVAPAFVQGMRDAGESLIPEPRSRERAALDIALAALAKIARMPGIASREAERTIAMDKIKVIMGASK